MKLYREFNHFSNHELMLHKVYLTHAFGNFWQSSNGDYISTMKEHKMGAEVRYDSGAPVIVLLRHVENNLLVEFMW